MKPRHLRRLVVALAAGGLLLLVASLVLGVLHSREDAGDGDSDPLLGPDDPGGFRHFQDELVRRKQEEIAERAARNLVSDTSTGSTVTATRGTSTASDVIDVSAEDTVSYIRAASRWNEQRLQRVQEVCARHNLGLYRSSGLPGFKLPPTPQYSVFYYDRSHKMAWCPLYKAGSTSWLYNLCLLGGYSERELRDTREQLSTLARKAYPQLEYPEAEEALGSSRKVLIVRHPMARLLSAYRDKLENRVAGAEHGTAHFYRKYGRRIVDKYRPRGPGGSRPPTSALLRHDQVVRDPGKLPPADDEPTFREFVRYLIDLDLANYADDHWIPYYLFCTPCLLNYDVIAKVETYLEDQVYIIRVLNLQDSIRPRWRHRSGLSSHGVNSVASKYFSQISETELRALYDKYKLDFELFDYSLQDYLPFVSKN